jgi:hypothetical protein
MKIPKCKECECIWNIPIADYSNINEHYCHWWCMNDFHCQGGKIEITKTGYKGTDGKRIISNEFKTSPKWCPKRK